jgi:hypothetical protein
MTAGAFDTGIGTGEVCTESAGQQPRPLGRHMLPRPETQPGEPGTPFHAAMTCYGAQGAHDGRCGSGIRRIPDAMAREEIRPRYMPSLEPLPTGSACVLTRRRNYSRSLPSTWLSYWMRVRTRILRRASCDTQLRHCEAYVISLAGPNQEDPTLKYTSTARATAAASLAMWASSASAFSSAGLDR